MFEEFCYKYISYIKIVNSIAWSYWLFYLRSIVLFYLLD